MAPSRRYVGRFAPSPTGPLHLGSAVAAIASYLDARANNGTWLLRIEDLDPPREDPAAPGIICDQLTSLGLHWDGDILYQHTRLDAYADALSQLRDAGLVYPCVCSRRSTPPIYPGTCRLRTFDETREDFAVRLLTDNRNIAITDRIFGPKAWSLETDIGDFIVRRKDGLFAYQLAVVVDDAFQGVTDIVRGFDLMDSTPRQAYLAQCLGYDAPRYAHFPVIAGMDGHKLSKQAHAAAIRPENALETVRAALSALGQVIPDRENAATTVDRLLSLAIDHWNPALIPKIDSLPAVALPGPAPE